ncbi:LLM class flavin-dependent oxidoreductase [Micromonospora sp. BRA006-A]|nr:LLM class flavin-dependent oxidoreductase [Micromonospora sp. BRA006-A]
MASLGDRNVRMTAEIADGWLPFLYDAARGRRLGAALAAGRAKRSADLGPLEVVAGGPMAIGPDVTRLRDLARPLIALYVGGMGAKGRNFYHDLLCRYGYAAEADRIQDLYLAGRRPRPPPRCRRNC